MKASEIIKQYKNGQRNFQRQNLRGANFQGQNLSEADFSYCDIRGANFSKAILTGAKFCKIKAGLQKRWVIFLLLLVFLLILFSSVISVLIGYTLSLMLSLDLVSEISGRVSFVTVIIIIIFCFISYRHKLGVELGALVGVGAFSGAYAGVIAFIVSGAGAVTFAFAGAFAGVVAFFLVAFGAFAGALAFTGAVAFALAFAGAFALVLVGIAAYVITGALAEVGAFTLATSIVLVLAFAIALILFGCYIGYRTLKDETKDSWFHKTVVAFSSIGGTSFYKATLIDADFSEATLKNTNFNKAILTGTSFQKAIKLNLARAGNTILSNPKVRDLLINPSSGSEQDYFKADLRGANLNGANLQSANLKRANLSGASLQYANLSDANLKEVNAVATDFSHSYCTGACLEGWNINQDTKLDDIDCQYIYLLEFANKDGRRERRPSNGNFQAKEFTQIFQQVFNTVTLTFQDGINWEAFLKAFEDVNQQIKIDNEDSEIIVQSIENKGQNFFVLKVNVPPNANKEKIHYGIIQMYQRELKAIEERYKTEQKARDEDLASYRQHHANLIEIIKLKASQPIENIIDFTDKADGYN